MAVHALMVSLSNHERVFSGETQTFEKRDGAVSMRPLAKAEAGWYTKAKPPPRGYGFSEGRDLMLPEVKQDCLKRLSYIEGHLAGIRRMVEEDKYCVDVLKQTYAVRRAIGKLEGLMLQGHLHTCVIDGVKDGREEQVLGELLELYSLAEK